MLKTKFSILLLVLILAQINAGKLLSQTLPKVIPPSPEQAKINKFGDIPVSYNTGVPSISVPIYTITTKSGLSIPISLDYHASGIKVDEQVSDVGLGWVMNAGYSISVSANGWNDLKDGMSSGSTILPQKQDFNPAADFHNPPSSGVNDYELAKDYVANIEDAQPDIFQYNMAGRSGKFVLDQNPQGIEAHTIPFEPISISMPLSNGETVFHIKDEQGNLFVYDKIEKQTMVTSGTKPPGYVSPTVNMPAVWYLTTITTFQGEVITFSYEGNSYTYQVSETETKYYPFTSNHSSCVGISNPNTTSHMTIDGHRLKSITYAGGHTVVDFSYDSSRALTSSVVKVGGVTLKNFALNNSGSFDAGSGLSDFRYRRKLSSITETITNLTWSFGYEENVNLPPRFSKKQDYWGYYNGKSNTSLITAYQGYGPTNNDRSADDTKATANILKSITYPTGGTTSFEYESNEYFGTYLGVTGNHKTGGLRVKSFTSSGSGDSYTMNYDYTKPDNPSQSSGDMLNAKHFAREIERENAFGTCSYMELSSGSLLTQGSSANSGVNYRYVTVTNGNGNVGSTIYEYSSFKDVDYPDFDKATSNAHRRGQLLKVTVMDKDDKKQRVTTNTYSYDDHFTDGVYNDFKVAGDYYILGGLSIKETKPETSTTAAEFEYEYYYIGSSWRKLISTKVDYYDPDGINKLTEVTTYSYGNPAHQQPTQVSTTASKSATGTGTTLLQSTKYLYPHDVPQSGAPTEVWHSVTALQDLINDHRIGVVLEESQYLGTGYTFLSSLRTHYAKYRTGPDRYAPTFVETKKGSAPFETRINYHKFDDSGNYLELSQEGGSKVTYLWGYNDAYPVAKIENADYATVSAVITQSILDDPSTDSALQTELNKLRTATSLKYALVTTMTYRKGVGMTSQTGPNGITVYYEYDASGRLQYIKDQDGNILKMNEYAYQQTANTTGN